MVHFSKPNKKQRQLLWERLFDSFDMEEKIDFTDLADKYELSGGAMINVLRFCALNAARRNEKKIERKDILKGIQREYRKSNKTL